MLSINRGFKSVIYRACHNRDMEKTLNRYDFYITHGTIQKRYPANYLTTILEEHRAIFEAFKARDVEAGIAAAEHQRLGTLLRRK